MIELVVPRFHHSRNGNLRRRAARPVPRQELSYAAVSGPGTSRREMRAIDPLPPSS
jgi:hypothetical protein